jgi:WD40 repeat protein
VGRDDRPVSQAPRRAGRAIPCRLYPQWAAVDGGFLRPGARLGRVRDGSGDEGDIDIDRDLSPRDGPLDLGAVSAAAFSADGRLILTVAAREVRVWDAHNNLPIGPPLNCGDTVRAAWLSPNGDQVLTLTAREARLWSLCGNNELGRTLDHDASVSAVHFSRDGRQALTVTYQYRSVGLPFNSPRPLPGHVEEVRVWDVLTGQPLTPSRRHEGRVWPYFTPAGARYATDGLHPRIWDPTTGKPVFGPLEHDDPARFLAVSANGRCLVTGVPVAQAGDEASRYKTIFTWDAETGAPLSGPLHHDGEPIGSVELTSDGRWLVTAAVKDGFRIWETATGRAAGRPIPLGGSVILSPDGASLLVHTEADRTEAERKADQLRGRGPDGPWRLWDVSSGRAVPGLLPRMAGQGLLISDVAFRPDGRQFVTCEENLASLRDPASGAVRHALPHRLPLTSAAYSPDGRRLVTTCQTAAEGSEQPLSESRLWDTRTGEPLTPPIPGTTCSGANPFSADGTNPFSPDGDYVELTQNLPPGQGPRGGLWLPVLFRLYHVPTGMPLTPAREDTYFFSPDSRRLLLVRGSRVQLIDLSPTRDVPEWAELAELVSGHRLDRSGAASPLSAEEMTLLWQRLRTEHPAHFTITPAEGLAWHRHAALDSLEMSDWYGMVWHLDRLIPAVPPDGRLHLLRGIAHYRLGESSRAEDDLRRAIEMKADDGRANLLLRLMRTGPGKQPRRRRRRNQPADADGIGERRT